MSNKKWTAVAGVLLLSGIVASAIFLQQRNETRQRWRESREQSIDLERRTAELNESLEQHRARFSAETDLAQKNQEALTAVELQSAGVLANVPEGNVSINGHADSPPG